MARYINGLLLEYVIVNDVVHDKNCPDVVDIVPNATIVQIKDKEKHSCMKE